MTDTLRRTLRTLVAALAAAAALALGPVVSACRAADVDACVRSLGTFPEAFFVGATYGVGTALVTLLINFSEDKGIRLLPK